MLRLTQFKSLVVALPATVIFLAITSTPAHACYQLFGGKTVCAQCGEGFQVNRCIGGCDSEGCTRGYGECCPDSEQYENDNLDGTTCTSDPYCTNVKTAKDINTQIAPITNQDDEPLRRTVAPSQCRQSFQVVGEYPRASSAPKASGL